MVWFALPVLGALDDPSALLMSSFTRAAAQETRVRLATERGGDPDRYRPSARTVHSEALRLLREAHGDVALYSVGRRATQDGDLEELLPEDRLGQDGGRALRQAARQVWDLARNRLEAGDLRQAYSRVAPDYSLAEIQAEIEAYEAEKDRLGQLDYTDLLLQALDLPPPSRALVLVDEAQDSSPLQWALLERWGAAADTFVLVGDLDQSVHRWCGACPERLAEHARSGAFEVRRLDQSWRVPRAVHALTVPLIRQNRARIDAPYLPAQQEGSVVSLDRGAALTALDQAAQAGVTAFVLGRSRRALEHWALELELQATPYAHERGFSPAGDDQALAATRGLVALRTSQGCSTEEAHALLTLAPVRATFRGAKRDLVLEALRLRPQELVTSSWLEAAFEFDLGPLLDRPSLADGLSLLRLHSHGSLAVRRARGLARLVEAHGVAVLAREPAIRLTTYHGAKGRQADLVVVDLATSKRVLEPLQDEHLRETERQLLYVALTRTRDRLILVRGERRDLGEELGLA